MRHLLSIAIVFIYCMSFSLPSHAAEPDNSQVEKNKTIATRYLQALGTPEAEQVSKELLASDHTLLRSEFENLKYNAADSELMKGSLPAHEAITDRTNTITALIGEGNMIAARIRVEGTHVGNLYGVPATNKPFWFDEIAIFQLANGKITESWHLANDGRFLIQIGERLPARADGQIIPPPYDVEAYPGDHWVAKFSRDGIDSPQERNKITVAKYNADRFRGGGTLPIAKIYDEYLHSGNQVTRDLMEEIERVTGKKVPGSFPAAWSGRSDLLVNMIAEGNMMIMQFQLNALNSGPLYTIPPTGKQIRSWEVLVAEFDGEKWKSAWWFGDDLGLYLKLGSKEALSFFFDDVSVPR